MLNTLFFPPPSDHRGEDTLNYEWAEYNLPAAADVDILRERSKQCPEHEGTL